MRAADSSPQPTVVEQPEGTARRPYGLTSRDREVKGPASVAQAPSLDVSTGARREADRASRSRGQADPCHSTGEDGADHPHPSGPDGQTQAVTPLDAEDTPASAEMRDTNVRDESTAGQVPRSSAEGDHATAPDGSARRMDAVYVRTERREPGCSCVAEVGQAEQILDATQKAVVVVRLGTRRAGRDERRDQDCSDLPAAGAGLGAAGARGVRSGRLLAARARVGLGFVEGHDEEPVAEGRRRGDPRDPLLEEGVRRGKPSG